MLVLNAGVFPGGQRIDSLASEEWRRVMQINLDANLALHARVPSAAQAGAPQWTGGDDRLEERAGARARCGRLFGVQGRAHAARARRCARVGTRRDPHQHLCIPTPSSTPAIWTEEVLAERAQHYGLSVDEYKKNNVLKVEVTQPRRRRAGRRDVRSAVRQDHRRASAGGRRQRPGDLTARATTVVALACGPNAAT